MLWKLYAEMLHSQWSIMLENVEMTTFDLNYFCHIVFDTSKAALGMIDLINFNFIQFNKSYVSDFTE